MQSKDHDLSTLDLATLDAVCGGADVERPQDICGPAGVSHTETQTRPAFELGPLKLGSVPDNQTTVCK